MRKWLVSFILALAACHSDAIERQAVEAGVASVAAAPSSAPIARRHQDVADAGVDPLCKTLLAEEKLDESALRDDPASAGPRIRCMGDGAHAWAVRADKGDAGTSIRQTILYAGSDGTRARLASVVDGAEWPAVFGRHAAIFDFDNDGVPELVASISRDVRTFTPASRIFVTIKKGAIVPYPTGGSFLVDGVMDLDKDGRPDLRVSFALGKRTVCAKTDEGDVEVELAAHALPDGKLSLTDAVAASYAAKHCPSMPASDALFTPPVTGPDDRDLSLSTIACERMRGKSADAVVAEIKAACAPYADAAQKCSGPCRHAKDAIAVASFAPPLQLK